MVYRFIKMDGFGQLERQMIGKLDPISTGENTLLNRTFLP